MTTGPADLTVSSQSLSISEAASAVTTRCRIKGECGGEGAILRLVASILAGACCCCRHDHTAGQLLGLPE
jgi:hypothetical protein